MPDSLHGLPVTLPEPFDVKLTVPVGVVGPVVSVSVTVAVHVIDWFTATLAGEQLTPVEVLSGGV